MAEPARKKRKKDNRPDGPHIEVNGKFISFAGYLNEPESKPAPKDSGIIPLKQTTKHVEESVPSTRGPPPQQRRSKKSSRKVDSGDPTFLKVRQALPIWESRDKIRQLVATNDVLVLVGETGSGKSTQIPQFLYDEPWCEGKIAITQPRRIAATSLAHRVAQEAGTPLSTDVKKGLVGYSVRFDHQVPRGAKIKFLTEGMLLQELLRDPGLQAYSAVIVDEVHERSVDSDLLLGFLKQMQMNKYAARNGVPLKIVVMSATANVDKIMAFFSSDEQPSIRTSLLEVPGRQFPVDIIYTPKPVPNVLEATAEAILKINTQEPCPGDILAFLPGQDQIEATQKLIEEEAKGLPSNVPKIKVFPLFGQLSKEAQQRALEPVGAPMTRKVVLATNIAETSVTVPGMRYVVDGGKTKVKQWVSSLGLESLLVKTICQSSATQRAGRAGREAAGKCYRLYPESVHDNFETISLPEILRTDVVGAVLTMKARGIEDVFSFPLMDAPPTKVTLKAHEDLWRMGALAGSDGSITDIGKQMARFPVPAAYGRVLIAAADPQYDCLLDAIDIIACLTAGEDLFHHLTNDHGHDDIKEARKELHRREGDLLTYLTTIQRYISEEGDQRAWCSHRKINMRTLRQALHIRRQLRGMCRKQKLIDEVPEDPQPFTPPSPEGAETLIKCFLEGFVARTAMLEMDGSYVTTMEKNVVAIHPSSVLHGGQKREAIMFLENVFTRKNYVKKVTAIQSQWIVDYLQKANQRK